MRVVSCLTLFQDSQLDKLVDLSFQCRSFLGGEWLRTAMILLGRCPCLALLEFQGEGFQTRGLFGHAAPEQLAMPLD